MTGVRLDPQTRPDVPACTPAVYRRELGPSTRPAGYGQNPNIAASPITRACRWVCTVPPSHAVRVWMVSERMPAKARAGACGATAGYLTDRRLSWQLGIGRLRRLAACTVAKHNRSSPGVRTWSPTVLLIWPNGAYVPSADGMGGFHHGMNDPCQQWRWQAYEPKGRRGVCADAT